MTILLLKPLRPLAMLILLTGFAFVANAQQVDSVWYDRKWKETTLPEQYYYLRTIKAVADAGYEVTDHYPGGNVQMKGFFSSIEPEVRNGEFWYYTEDRVLNLKNIWVNNIVAETFTYDATGKQLNHIIKREYLATLSAKEKLEKYGIQELEKQPEFPGGNEAFSGFLTRNIKYPPMALQENLQGQVLIAATIDERGHLKQIRILKSAHPLLDNEALRVANLLPKKKWTPAQIQGKSVSAEFAFPVLFKL